MAGNKMENIITKSFVHCPNHRGITKKFVPYKTTSYDFLDKNFV